MKIASSAAVRAAEQQLFAQGRISSLQLMDRVISRLVELFRPGRSELADFHPEHIIVAAGKGNNAGDAIGLAAALRLPVTLLSTCPPDQLSPDTRAQLARIPAELLNRQAPEPRPNTLLIDGLLGSGASGPLREPIRSLARQLNRLRTASPRSLTLAIDIPTGLDADTGRPDPDAIRADISCPIGCVKPGMLRDGAEQCVGRLLPIPLPEISIAEDPSSGQAPRAVADLDLMRGWLPPRPRNSYKNSIGRIALIAGSPGMIGAAQLAAEAALHAGAGLISLHCPRSIYPILAARIAAEIMVQPIDSIADIREPQARALLIGPGLGTALSQSEKNALRQLAEQFPGTVVLDADGLNIAAADHWQPRPNWILTPHPGEMRRLLPSAPNDRLETALLYRRQHSATLLLKGARTLIVGDEGITYNSSGGPCMANGGQGDVLSGVITALAAQGLSPCRAAALGAWACGQSALLAQTRRGLPPAVTPGEVSRGIGEALAMLPGA